MPTTGTLRIIMVGVHGICATQQFIGGTPGKLEMGDREDLDRGFDSNIIEETFANLLVAKSELKNKLDKKTEQKSIFVAFFLVAFFFLS